MSRNLTFFILGLTAAVIAYIFAPSLTGVLEFLLSERLPREFTRLMQNNDLVVFAGYVSLFGLSFFLLYLVFPVAYVWYHINSAKGIVDELPLVSNAIKRTDKKTFLGKLKGLGFIERLAEAYGPYLIQGPEEDVKPENLKKIRLTGPRAKIEKIVIAPVSAAVPAESIFNVESMVSDNLRLGFFTIFARLMVGAGVVCLAISLISFSIVKGEDGQTLLTALQPGLVSLLYLLIAAVILSGGSHLVSLGLSHKAGEFSRMINGLFYQNNWQQDLGRITTHLEGSTDKFEIILRDSLHKPLKEISTAVKSLSVEQEKKLDNILSKTLENFAANMVKKTGADTVALNKALKEASLSAEKMKKQFTGANADFAKQMDKQSAAIAKHLSDMQKVLANSEKATQAGAEKIISKLATQVENTHKKFGDYIESNLQRLDEKQKKIENTTSDKDGILKDLHDTAKDLATISNASGILLERFISLSVELDVVLKNIQENNISPGKGDAQKRDKLKSAMMKLKKINKDKIGELPDM